MHAFEEKLHLIIDRYLFEIGLALLILASVIIRWHMAPIEMLSPDYQNYISNWFEYYQTHGLAGLREPIGNYYIPYNLFLALSSYLPFKAWLPVSLFSCLFEYLAAWYIYKISGLLLESNGDPTTDRTTKRKALLTGVISLFIPITFLNSSLWKQCDSIYVCFIIMAIYYVLKDKYGRSLLFLGLGFIFKLQAVFLLPFYILLYIGRKKNLSILHFLIIPLTYLLGGLPAVLAGRRITNVYGIYYRQMRQEGYNAMTINFPNLYGLGLSDYPALSLPFTILTMCIFILFAIFLQRYFKYQNRSHLVYIAIWCLWTCAMFLPAIHERYNYAVELLTVAFYLITDRKKIWIAFTLNLNTIVLYSTYLFGGALSIPFPVMSIFNLIAYGYATYDLINKIHKTTVTIPANV